MLSDNQVRSTRLGPHAPLSGLRVVEFSESGFRLCGRILGELGADVVRVIRVESRGSSVASVAEEVFYDAFKRCLTVEINTAIDKAVHELISKADVIIVTDGADDVLRPFRRAVSANKRATVSYIRAVGDGGPYAGFQVSEEVVQALSGLTQNYGRAGNAPQILPGDHAYGMAAAAAAFDILVSIWGTLRGQPAQTIEVSALECLAATGYRVVNYASDATVRGRAGGRVPTAAAAPIGVYPTMDGAVFIFVISRRHWHTFFDWIGCPPELEDRVWENRHFRVQNWDVLDNYAAKLFAGISTESAVSFGRNNGLLIAPVNAPLGVFEHPQLKWREWLAAEESGGSRRLPRTPVCFYGRSAPHIRPLTDLPTGEWLSLPLQWSNPGPFQGGGKTRRCNSPAKRLHGLRVVELTMELAGPTLGRLLAERGASVIKIESETHRLRAGIGPGLNESMRLQQQLVYADTNRFRKFISLNLKKAEGRELLHKLLGNSDVFITNLSPRILREWELTPDRLSSRHPELLGVYLTYGGLEGPERDTVGVALTAAAEAGQYQLWGGLESASTVFHTDTFQGIYGGVALLASTVGVQRGLPRVHVDNALLEASAFCNGAQYVSMAYDSEESPKEVKTVTHAVLPALGLDKWLYIELNEPSLGILESLLGYPRQEGEAREREQKIVDGLSTWLLQRNPRTAMQVLQAAGLRAVSVSDEEDVFFDPHLRQRRWYARFTTSDGRGRDVPGFLGSTCSPITDISVTCGEIGSSNQEVFEKELALPPEEVADLTRRGVLY